MHKSVKAVLGVLAVSMVAAVFNLGAGMAEERVAVDRQYRVVMKFAQSTVAEIDTIAVVNTPSDLWMYSGERVEVEVRNDSPIPEGFAIDELGVMEVLEPGEVRTFVLNAPQPGAYTIYCQLHPLGVHHTGTLLVLERR